MQEIARFDAGDGVYCDLCSTDLTNDPRTGGFIFVTQGVGPCCAERFGQRVSESGEEREIRPG